MYDASKISLNASIPSLPFLISFIAISYPQLSVLPLPPYSRTPSKTHLQQLLVSSHHLLCSYPLLSWIDQLLSPLHMSSDF